MDHQLLILFLLNLAPLALSAIIDPILTLPNGKILGREAFTYQNTSYFAYEGIPYAAAPVGKLRFQPPQPAEDWQFLLDATEATLVCYQSGDNFPHLTENCLVLNVYTTNFWDDSDYLPVMVFIHGGGYAFGTGNTYQPDLFMDNGVILVTINYRLGVFGLAHTPGFLSTEDEVVPGNNGLKDQLQALQWVYDNIHVFRGDRTKITIFGQSAGSMSCALHVLNKKSEGLYQGTILESGSSLSPVTLQRNARAIAFRTAALLNSTFAIGDDSTALLEFLQSVDAEELNAAAALVTNSYNSFEGKILTKAGAWGPVIEVPNSDAFLTEKMYKLLKNGDVVAVPTMIGFNSEESLGLLEDLDATVEALAVIDEDLGLLVPEDMGIRGSENLTAMGTLIRDIYTGGDSLSDHVEGGIRFSSDNGMTRPTIKLASLYSAVADTYFYQFSYDGGVGGIDVHYDGVESVGHGEELNYLFCSGSSCGDSSISETDQLVRQRLITLWTNFAKYQNPTPDVTELFQNTTWPKLFTEYGDFLYVDITDKFEVKPHPKGEIYEKWTTLYDSLGYDDFDTY